MKLRPSDEKMVELMRNAGGSYCPGRDVTINREVRRILRRLETKGIVTIEETDDGPRFTLTPQGREA